MIKQIRKYAQEHQLTWDVKSNFAYGKYNGQAIGIWETNDQYLPAGNQPVRALKIAHVVKIWATTDDPMVIGTIQGYLQQMPGKVEFLQQTSYDGKLITAFFVTGGSGWAKRYTAAIDVFLRDVTNLCASYTVTTGCEFCKAPDQLGLYQINQVPYLVCPNCVQEVNQQASQSKAQFQAQGQGNVLSGIVGACLGALLGVVLWVIIYQLGYISMIGALALVVCAFKGYEVMGGHMTKLGIFICCVVSVIMLLFAEQICVALLIYDAFHAEEGISFFDAFRAVPYFLMEAEVLKAVLPDVLLGGLCVIGCGIERGIRVYKDRTGAVATRMITRFKN
ncbi:MAG: hypothetical protein IJ747_08870 [Lachnospiraceae bacterium]|nr:hypothetical protein [Lachnospiraceae bacterium]